MPREKALDSGAMALFGEKYGDEVRVLTVGREGHTESVELCGGTHLTSTGQAGLFVILSESGISAGVRRIEALTGWNAFRYMAAQRSQLHALSGLLKSRPDDVLNRVDGLLKENRQLRRDLDKAVAASSQGNAMNEETVNGIELVTAKLAPMPVKTLREVMDDVRSKHVNGVVCLAAPDADNPDGKAALILYVPKALHGRFTAPALIKTVAVPMGGSGGGRPDQAQAGGSNPAGIDEAFALLRQALGA